MKIVAAAIQLPFEVFDVAGNLQRADDRLRAAHEQGAELAVLPELFNTGYSLCPDFGPYSEAADGPTIMHLRR
ncbi:MAG: carbon-nitrogen hydrolase family protein, partial [Planctomycetota bacterium]|nr:carbon-nitrogen hydrolase family protein [Planctomycetota bacterium]